MKKHLPSKRTRKSRQLSWKIKGEEDNEDKAVEKRENNSSNHGGVVTPEAFTQYAEHEDEDEGHRLKKHLPSSKRTRK